MISALSDGMLKSKEWAQISYFREETHEKQTENRLLILTPHLKSLSLSFQKIIKLTLVDQQTKLW